MGNGFGFIPEQASKFAPQLDHLYFFVIAVSVFFFALICVLIYVFAVKYQRRSDEDRPKQIHGNLLLEITWSVIPLILMMIMFVWGTELFFKVYEVPENALEINVVGKQWMWHIQHPTGQREINELHVPVGRPIKLTIASEDVIHSFFVPAFRIKVDAVPGRYTTMTFEATKTGSFHLFCAEYCGTEHSRMTGQVIVMDEADYQDWLSGGASSETPEQTGARLFTQLTCITCHGDQSGARGPSLRGVFGGPVELASGGSVEMDEAYIRESILRPRAKIVAGYQSIMPTFQGQVTEANILNIVAYIKSLPGYVEPRAQRAAAPVQAQKPAQTGKVVTVIMEDFLFKPAVVNVKAGDVIHFINKDPFEHTVHLTRDGIETFPDQRVGQDGTVIVPITAAGAYRVECTIHAGMTGKVQAK